MGFEGARAGPRGAAVSPIFPVISCETPAVADRRYGTASPPTETEVANADWYGRDLSGCEHTRVAFVDVDLTESSGKGAVFTECTFRSCRLSSAQFKDAAFLNCTFTSCVFFDASFVDCKLVGSTFYSCRFGPIVCEGGDWSFVGLAGADLRNARFTGVRMREADLSGAQCAGATLRELDLSGAAFHGADLERADVRGSDISSLDPAGTRLRGMVVDPDQTIVIADALGLDVRSPGAP
jgi:fluoroquinolone resistance protein